MEKRKLIIGCPDGTEYEISGTGGEGVRPAPNSVGTQEIEDGGVHEEDLDDGVKEGLDELNNISITDEELEEIFKDENQDAGFDVGADEPDPDDI